MLFIYFTIVRAWRSAIILGHLSGLASRCLCVIGSGTVTFGSTTVTRVRSQYHNFTNGQLLNHRSDISGLKEHHPTLAGGFDFLRQELDSPFPSLELLHIPNNERLEAQEAIIRRRNRAAHDLDHTLELIHKKPGFENLRIKSEKYLLSAAEEGPIVVLIHTPGQAWGSARGQAKAWMALSSGVMLFSLRKKWEALLCKILHMLQWFRMCHVAQTLLTTKSWLSFKNRYGRCCTTGTARTRNLP